MLSFIDHTPERLPHNSERQADRRGHSRDDKRPDSRLRHFHREYARGGKQPSSTQGSVKSKRQYHLKRDIAFMFIKELRCFADILWEKPFHANESNAKNNMLMKNRIRMRFA